MFFSFGVILAQDKPVRIKAPSSPSKITPFTMIFAPEKNAIIKEKQKIDYDLSKPSQLRLGPFVLNQGDVSMQISREEAEFVDIEFGLEAKKYIRSIYIISFTWPRDYLSSGTLEIVNDKSETLWRDDIDDEDVEEWQTLLNQSSSKLTDKEILDFQKKLSETKEGRPDKQSLYRAKNLSRVHKNSSYGNSHQRFYDIPLADIKGPFRFCVAKRNPDGRLALCSKRYEFVRRFGRYALKSVSQKVRPKVQVNDKNTSLRGTAIFLDFETPIKLSAMMDDGTYFEFISRPKQIEVMDIALDTDKDLINLVGFGARPIGLLEEDIYADNVLLGFLNFMPTIGDLKDYWRATMDPRAPYLYVKGKGGAPFRQSFTFKDLPTEKIRPSIDPKSQKSTYSYKAKLKGYVDTSVQLSTPRDLPDASVERLDGESFEWNFISEKRGKNIGYLNLNDGENTWQAQYELYRGYPGEISARFTGVVSDDLDLVILGEVAGQYWFENILGSQNFYLSQLRWGLSAKYFETIFVGRDDPDNQGLVSVNTTEVNLKYRLDPGIWGRDPSVGFILGYQGLSYEFRQSAVDFNSKNGMLGAGVFWARSMPKVFDDIFNIIPFFRYPKWVDMDAIYYPLSTDSLITQKANVSFNFHGKIAWTDRFFGEGGFGLKVYSYADPNINKNIGFGLAYGTVGLGMNF